MTNRRRGDADANLREEPRNGVASPPSVFGRHVDLLIDERSPEGAERDHEGDELYLFRMRDAVGMHAESSRPFLS